MSGKCLKFQRPTWEGNFHGIRSFGKHNTFPHKDGKQKCAAGNKSSVGRGMKTNNSYLHRYTVTGNLVCTKFNTHWLVVVNLFWHTNVARGETVWPTQKRPKCLKSCHLWKKSFIKNGWFKKKSFHRHLKQNENDYFERKYFVSHFQLTVITLLGEFIDNFQLIR